MFHAFFIFIEKQYTCLNHKFNILFYIWRLDLVYIGNVVLFYFRFF